MTDKGFIYLIPNSWMKINNSGVSKYKNIALTKYPDDRLNYSPFIHVLKYFIETEAVCQKMRYIADGEIIGPIFEFSMK